MRPVLGVVIPTFNRAPTLPRALESVLSQQADGLEVIVVDDGSTDDTIDYLNSIDDPCLVVITQQNRGVCAARNAGVRATEAEFVTFLDSDDEALPGWVGQWLEFAARRVDFASCAVVQRKHNGTEVIVPPEASGAEYGFLRVMMLAGAYSLRRSLLLEIGGFREGLSFSENTELGFRLGARMLERPFSNEATDDPLVAVHQSQRTYDPAERFDSAVSLLEHDYEHLKRNPELLSTYFAIAGVAASKLGNRSVAVSYLWSAIRNHPTTWVNYARLARALALRPPQRSSSQRA